MDRLAVGLTARAIAIGRLSPSRLCHRRPTQGLIDGAFKIFPFFKWNLRTRTPYMGSVLRSTLWRNRCLIPASGYYEWQTTPTGKQPYCFSTENGSPLTIAGPLDEWNDIETGEPLKSCTMIITDQ